MFDVGFWELAVISVIALIIIGPERLPGAARTAGVWVGKARRVLRDVKDDIDRELRNHEVTDLKGDIQSAGKEFQSAASDINQTVGAGEMNESLRETFQNAAPTATAKRKTKTASKKVSKKKTTTTGKKTTKKAAKKVTKKATKKTPTPRKPGAS